MIPRVVFWVNELNAKRADRCHLRDVFAGLRPVEVRCVARQNDYISGRICLQFVGIEFVAKTDVEDTGYDCVHAVLGVSVRHELHTMRYFDPDRVGPRFRNLSYNDGKTHRRRVRGYGLPLEIPDRIALKTDWPG
jgi:hypothetical protein